MTQPSQHLESFTGEAPFARQYRILRQISAGGMGAVYLAEQVSTGKARALKLMHPELLTDDKLRERFEQEARVSSLIESDHVVEVIDAGIEPSSSIPWIAMELLVGWDLDRYMAEFGPVSPAAMLAILRQVCHALGAAHAVGVVHRDLKPENVFLTAAKASANEPTSIKVLDFGIAKVLAQVHRSTTALGTPLWMAPEQSDPRAAITPATDVWALGLFAFWLLTGKSFWMAMQSVPVSVQALMREVLFDPLPPLTERAAELEVTDKIPPGFAAWFERCVVRDPAQRFADARTAHGELVAALPALEAQSELPTLTAEQVGEPGQRNPRGLGLSLGLARLPGAGRSEMPEARSRSARRPPWLAISIGTLVGLALGGGAIAFALGYLRFGPPAPSPEAAATSAAASASATSSSEPIVSAVTTPPIASIRSSAVVSSAVVPVSARRSARSAPRALVVFDTGEAVKILQQKASNARNACQGREGPRGFSAKVHFNPRGTVRLVMVDPLISSQPTVLCGTSFLWGAIITPFDTPDEGTVSISVLLD